MQDLSNMLPGDPISCLVPSSMHGGNQVWSADNAMTAPGGASGDLGNDLGQAVVVPAPTVEATTGHTRTTVTHGDDAGPAGGQPVLVMGGWNDFGGGSAPGGWRSHG